MDHVNYWDGHATEFDSLYDSRRRVKYALNQVLRRGLYQRTEITCALLRQLGQPSVLDVGCGSGRNITSFFEAGASGVTGVDSSREMLKLAESHVTSAGFSERLRLVCDNFLKVKENTQYDVVVALGVFDYLHAEAPEFLRKMRRLARRAVVFSAPGPSLLRAPLRAFRYRFIKGIGVHFYSRKDLNDLCSLVGFQSYELRKARSSGHVVIAWSGDR
jgi:2-polyprenyl-3-methyl-5-hydroxy-6-metoxy-1,4-benzoquinol methylase